MASRLIYCKYEDCGVARPGHDKNLITCPACKRDANWTSPRDTPPPPEKPLQLGLNDRRFLQRLHIKAD